MIRFMLQILCLFFISLSAENEKKVTIIIPSYNNEKWCVDNLKSVLNQDYSNYEIIYIDDCSSDNTVLVVEQYLSKDPSYLAKTTVIKNKERKGALENFYITISLCNDSDIIALLDGDDWFSGNHVLKILNKAYSEKDIWITFGQFTQWPHNNNHGNAAPIPAENIEKNNFRNPPRGCPTHLKTFYAKLFKKIKKEDLLYKGSFYPMAWDTALMIPMLEMARERHLFIPDILYVYNTTNTISDHRVDRSFQHMLDVFIRNLQPYEKLEKLF